MKLEEQQVNLNVRNFDTILPQNKIHHKHGKLLPSSIRAVISGPSNAGKTNLLFSLIFDKEGLFFENIYLYSKSLNQPKYQLLRDIVAKIPGMGFYSFTENDEIITPEKTKPNSLMIFDDVPASGSKDEIRSFFCFGRHHQICTFYLCQTYTAIPKHHCRDNANFLILFKQDELNLKHIHSDHVNVDMTFEKFKQLCRECWQKDGYSFFVVATEFPRNAGRYRFGFSSYINIDD